MSEIILTLEGIDPVQLYGFNNAKLNLLKEAFPEIIITSRGNSLKLKGEKKYTQKAKSKIESMVRLIKSNKDLTTQSVIELLETDDLHKEEERKTFDNSKIIVHSVGGKPIRARTKNQKRMVDLSETNDIVFAIGPAGTGKTYTAVALAVKALKNKIVKKIILTRPAVEAGESLGFLPGDLKDKVDPYLRPLYDSLEDMIKGDKLNFLMENRTIEVAPLAFMRGRTLDNAFIILDEAQNCTTTQIKMFLTRLGPNAKCIITGDLSQIDLPRHQQSGLYKALDILTDINGVGFVKLDADDVVRHRLVKEIILRYNKEDDERNPNRREPGQRKPKQEEE